MKLLTGCLVLTILAGATVADAWSWPWSRRRTPRLPKPIDSPIVRPKAQVEKAERQQHPARVQRANWGQDKRIQETKHPHEGNHSMFTE